MFGSALAPPSTSLLKNEERQSEGENGKGDRDSRTRTKVSASFAPSAEPQRTNSPHAASFRFT